MIYNIILLMTNQHEKPTNNLHSDPSSNQQEIAANSNRAKQSRQ